MNPPSPPGAPIEAADSPLVDPGEMREKRTGWRVHAWVLMGNIEGLEAAGLARSDVPVLNSNDPRKPALAHFPARHTIVSQGWLADRLHLRSAANVSQQLRRPDPESLRRRLPPPLRRFLKTAGTANRSAAPRP